MSWLIILYHPADDVLEYSCKSTVQPATRTTILNVLTVDLEITIVIFMVSELVCTAVMCLGSGECGYVQTLGSLMHIYASILWLGFIVGTLICVCGN